MEVHDQVEEGGVLEGIVKGGQPGTGRPSHDVTLLIEECSLVREKRRRGGGGKRERERKEGER